MTGWRCGWSIGPAAVIAAQSAIQSHATSNVSSITQKAVTAALTGSQEPVALMLNEYRQRRDNLLRVADSRSADPLRESQPARSTCFPTSASVLAADGFATTTDFAAGAAG